MDGLEGGGLDWQRGFFLALFRAVVRDREAQTSGGARLILVVEPGRIVPALLAYALFYKRDSVFIFAYAFTWIPYVRNLIIHHRHERAQRPCRDCGIASPPAPPTAPIAGPRLDPAASPAESYGLKI